jgi:hypothetical protein
MGYEPANYPGAGTLTLRVASCCLLSTPVTIHGLGAR